MQNYYQGHTWRQRTKQAFMAALILFFSFAGYYSYSSQYIARQVYLQDELMEGLTREKAEAVVRDHLNSLLDRPIVLKDGKAEDRLNFADLGVDFDSEKTVDALFKVGRSLFLKAEILSFRASSPKKEIKPLVRFEGSQLESVLAAKLKAREYAVQNAAFQWSSGSGWGLRPERFGRKLKSGELERIAGAIRSGLYDANQPMFYHPAYETVSPTIFEEDLRPLLQAVLEWQKTPLEIQFGKIRETVEISKAGDWITFDYANQTFHVNQEKLKAFTGELAARFNIEPKTVIVKGVQEFVSEYNKESYKKAVIEGEMRSGRKIDEAKLEEDLKQVLTQNGPRKIEVAFQSVPAQIVSEVPGLEFPDRLSVGQSSYKLGNYPNRVHNIKHALKFQDLTVVSPGETFSYNKILGWVTMQKGYQKAKVIFGDTLVEAPGGGVCQTSTTMFRAIVNAGLPLGERTNHTWDVAYYRDWYGLDAAVYPPGRLDLTFLNDTPGPLLIHSYTDDENEIAYFEIYGKSDGRQVNVQTVENVRVGRGRRIVNDWEVIHPGGIVEKRQIVSRYRR